MSNGFKNGLAPKTAFMTINLQARQLCRETGQNRRSFYPLKLREVYFSGFIYLLDKRKAFELAQLFLNK